jgi:hypothetical protein
MDKMQKESYLKDSNRCPFCKSTDIEGGIHDAVDDTVYHKVFCYQCERHWENIYRLMDVEEVT